MKKSPTTSGVVQDGILVYEQDGQKVMVAVDEPSWYTWLETAMSFTFVCTEGTFTAQKARAGNRRGGWYWRAYRRKQGRLLRSYLGKSANLTLSRLREIAHHLAMRSEDTSMRKGVPGQGHGMLQIPISSGAPALLPSTKFTLPCLPLQHIARPHLVAQLERGARQGVAIICAPAGSGKTTLLVEWATSTALPVVWISLDVVDNDPSRFLTSLRAALLCFIRHSDTAGNYQFTQADDDERMLTSFLNDLASLLQQEVVVILDDYHLITEKRVHTALHFLLTHRPAHLHLIIGTRADPPVALSRLRTHGQLSEVRTEALRFVSSEIASLGSLMGITLSEEVRSLLAQRTEGWIAGVQLLLLALRGQADTTAFLRTLRGTHQFLLEYVSEEVLAGLPLAMQTFLRRTSLLERMTGPLCEAVTGQREGHVLLAQLRRANLFVSVLDETETWYRYHPMFSQVLRAQLHRSEPNLISELYGRASCWHEEHGDVEEACEYAFLAGDLSSAASLLATVLIPLVEQGKLDRLNQWLNLLPPTLVAASQELCVASIWMQTWRHPRNKNTPEIVEPMVAHMERLVQAQPWATTAPWVELQSELRLVHALRAFSHHDLVRTITLVHETLRLLSAQRTALSQFISFRLRLILSAAYRASGELIAYEQILLDIAVPQPTETYHPMSLIAVWSLAELYEAQGKLRKTEQLFERISDAFRSYPNLSPVLFAPMYVSKAALLYEWNRVPEAQSCVQQALAIAQGTDLLAAYSSLGLWMQARIELIQGQTETARSFLQQQWPSVDQSWSVGLEKRYLAAIAARLALACDDVKGALHWVATCGIRFDDQLAMPPENQCMFLYLTLARALIAQGRLQANGSPLSQALHLLAHLQDLAARMNFKRWFIEIQMLTVLALQAQGKTKQALTTLGSVLALAEPEGYVRLFVDEGEVIASLLLQISTSPTASSGYIQQILAAIPAKRPALPTPPFHQPLIDPLSVREREVLSLLAHGASNQQIADHLVISLNTAKRHVKHILAKLAVTNRTQAVVRARELHLL
ncbi:hypothetical protein EPA93_14290 [Ktedonosporobacter rubrisoli]|uniref:HTH luxR-type domain-containing protein n=1 Tax=Ktedonosporobacter rubrisoli TaxID=2509675 RepID=A0A4P6JQR6_KTERU|nr:LuxR C-terminal-related transcriptional regulator [Ktedonosporobacter rubrisoli]QBD77106.1 hypothetical protein EPA93_14290 [Ktedonosporobacter rubrisoli]